MTPRGELPKRKSHRLPMSVYANTQYQYYFTICACHQGAPFHNQRLAQIVVDSLLWTKEKYRWLLFCYCLMPDHLHFVCRTANQDVKLVNAGARGLQVEGVLDHVARFKSYTTNRWLRMRGVNPSSGKLWQKHSYDRVFDMERPFVEVMEFTLNNPVRKELVEDWQDYPYARIVDPWWT